MPRESTIWPSGGRFDEFLNRVPIFSTMPSFSAQDVAKGRTIVVARRMTCGAREPEATEAMHTHGDGV